ALEIDAENAEATKLLEEVKAAIVAEEQTALITKVEVSRSVRRQMADQDFDKVMQECRSKLEVAASKADFVDATNDALVAQNILERNKALYGLKRLQERRKEVTNVLTLIANRQAQWERRQRIRERAEFKAAEQQRRQRAEMQRRRKLETHTKLARSLIREHKFEQADKELVQILNIDPRNDWALGQRETLANVITVIRDRGLRKLATREMQKNLVAIRESEVPWYDIYRLPEDWKALTLRRQGSGVGAEMESEADIAVRHRLRQRMEKLDFDGIRFDDVIDYLREVAKVSIYVNWKALEISNIERTTEVNVRLAQVTFRDVLNTVLKDVSGASVGTPQEAAFVIQNGIIEITTRESLAHDVYPRVYDIMDLMISFPDVGVPTGGSLSSSGSGRSSGGGGSRSRGGGLSSSGGISGSSISFGSSGIGTSGQGAQNPDEMLQQIVDLISEQVAPDSWGIDAAITPFSGNLVVTQTAENHEKIMGLINQLREARAIQIAVETRFITVSTGFLNSIGLNLAMYFNIGSTTGGGAVPSTVDPRTGASVPVPSPSTWTSMGHSVSSGNSNFTPISFVQNSSDFTHNPTTGVQNAIGATVGQSAMTLGGTFLDDVQVDFLIQATQAHQLTRTLTAPRITLFNGQSASINIETQLAYVSDLDVEVEENAVGYDYTVEQIANGTQLFVRGTVSADRRYVTLTIIPRVQTILGLNWYPFNPQAVLNAGGAIAAGSAFIQLPEIQIQTLTTTVSVPDGGTLLLGGQKLSGEVEREKGVPLLSKIPFVNRLFTNRAMSRDESTLLILVKPKIIIQSEQERLLGG
ncbi:MAG: hypothetical protein J7M14_03860, partial [Planctomycetes bacterium]|nr:hypothetical protein [Planctomycetota bacterium]